MAKELHIDLETYSSVDIKLSGAYKYMESPDFEILMVAYAIDEGPINMVSLAEGESIHGELRDALLDPQVTIFAHNATFERNALKQYGFEIEYRRWVCTAVLSSYAGLPISLEKVSQALQLESEGKLTTGKALIKYFCVPVKPTKANGMRHRNMWYHDREKWEEFKTYCIWDVKAERAIHRELKGIDITLFERKNYILDQKINDYGVLVDPELANNAVEIDQRFTEENKARMAEITGLDNPNSPIQLKNWLGENLGEPVESLSKPLIPDLINKSKKLGKKEVEEALNLRLVLSKTSVKKYSAMINSKGDDDRIRGLVQFYGAGRTGRWAGRLVQVQNLPRNYMKDLDEARTLVKANDYDSLLMVYDNVPDVLSQLIRTAFIAPKGKTFAVCDFSAIEARVLAWLAGEEWRLEVFRTHGKIYEASASMMFKIPIESIGKGSDERQKGKVAELALGYQGSIGAMLQMGGEAMGLSETEMKRIVSDWRQANPNIEAFWEELNEASVKCVSLNREVRTKCGLIFRKEFGCMTIQLHSGKKLFYRNPKTFRNQWGKACVKYQGMIQETNSWGWISTYGGKLAENIVQAESRDLLAYNMVELDKMNIPIVMHIHDEIVTEVNKENAIDSLELMEEIMGQEVPWAKGLPLKGDGYLTDFYKKD